MLHLFLLPIAIILSDDSTCDIKHDYLEMNNGTEYRFGPKVKGTMSRAFGILCFL